MICLVGKLKYSDELLRAGIPKLKKDTVKLEKDIVNSKKIPQQKDTVIQRTSDLSGVRRIPLLRSTVVFASLLRRKEILRSHDFVGKLLNDGSME